MRLFCLLLLILYEEDEITVITETEKILFLFAHLILQTFPFDTILLNLENLEYPSFVWFLT